MKDYYKILDLSPEASQQEIKEQYRFLLQAWHPDKWPTPSHKARAGEKTKEINKAYAVLGDRKKRADYDRRRPSPPPSSAEQAEQAEREARRRAADKRRRRAEEKQRQQAADFTRQEVVAKVARRESLSGANLSGANLSIVRYNARTMWPEGFDPVAAGAVLVE
mgnify:CR=1 FL=1